MDCDFPKILERTSNLYLLHVRDIVLVIVLAALCVTTAVVEPETWLEELDARLAYAARLHRNLHGMRHG